MSSNSDSDPTSAGAEGVNSNSVLDKSAFSTGRLRKSQSSKSKPISGSDTLLPSAFCPRTSFGTSSAKINFVPSASSSVHKSAWLLFSTVSDNDSSRLSYASMGLSWLFILVSISRKYYLLFNRE